MRRDVTIDMEKHWKLLTILIGANDMCRYCDNTTAYSPTQFKYHLKHALDKLQRNVPRMLINLVPMFSVTVLPELSRNPLCDVVQQYMCGCGHGGVPKHLLSVIDDVAHQYYVAMRDLATSGNYDSNNFTVVLQPALYKISLPYNRITGEIDKTIVGPDCFHPSNVGHELLAYNLWNTMIRYPVGTKPLQYPIYTDLDTGGLKYACPDNRSPYIWTNWNSKMLYFTKVFKGNATTNFSNSTTTYHVTTSTTLDYRNVTTPAEQESKSLMWILIGSVAGTVKIIFVVIVLLCSVHKCKTKQPKNSASEES